jgi:probable HAF family extracellular repeat protein
MHRALLSAVLSLSVVLSTLVAAQDASYTFTTIDVPGAQDTEAHDINTAGEIVGWFRDASGGLHGFLTDGTTFTTIDAPSTQSGTLAWGINTAGQIVGRDGNHGFLTDGTTFTTINVPGAVQTFATGINTMGQIVGWFRKGTEDDTENHGFVKDGDTITAIDVPGADVTEAHGINTAGEIVGWFRDATGAHGFLTDGTTFTTIDVPGAVFTQALGINDSGQIVGVFNIDHTRPQGFLTDGTTFTTINVPGAGATGATGINTAGQIVGWYGGGPWRGFLATPREADTTPPVITVSASPATLWPPDGRLVTVTVSGRITDEPGGSGVQANSAVYQVTDEYEQIQPNGDVPLVNGRYSFTVALQASRRGNDQDGRHYTIVVNARDNAGNLGHASATVTVPRN